MVPSGQQQLLDHNNMYQQPHLFSSSLLKATSTATAALLDLRGGATRSSTSTTTTKKKKRSNRPHAQKVDDDDAIVLENDDNDDGVVVQKLRRLVRSLLRSTRQHATVQTVIRRVASKLESLFGVRLLPAPKTKKSKASQKKKKSSTKRNTSTKTVSLDAEEDSEVEDVSTTAVASDERQSSSSSKREKSTKTKAKPTKTAQKHLQTKLASNNPNYRIQRELKAFLQDPPDHLTVKVGKNIRIWIVTMEGLGIYKGETFQLRIQFPANYPTRPPSVYFLPPNIPVHEHVYTNGDICLSLLGKDWRPTMTAQSIAHSILSILASAARKSRPMDNARHAHNKPGEYQAEWCTTTIRVDG